MSQSEPKSDLTQPPVPERAGIAAWGGQIGGGVLLVVSVIFLVGGVDLGLGSPFRLGTGAFPFATGLVLGLLAIAICVQEWRSNEGLTEAPDWVSFLAIIAALGAFAATADRFGLIPSVFLTVVVASSPDRTLSWPGKAMLGSGVAIAAWLLFIKALNLPFKTFEAGF